MIQRILAIWSLVPLPFLKPAWTSESSRFMYCWSMAWRILSITLLACEMSAIVQYWASLALPFFGIGMKTDLFQSCGHCWVFQICWHIECSTSTLMAESEEDLKSLLMRVKEESEKTGLRLNIQKSKIMATGPITSWQIDAETVSDFFWGAPKSLQMVIAAMKLQDTCSLELKLWPT